MALLGAASQRNAFLLICSLNIDIFKACL